MFGEHFGRAMVRMSCVNDLKEAYRPHQGWVRDQGVVEVAQHGAVVTADDVHWITRHMADKD